MYKTQFLRLSFICGIAFTDEVAETSCHIVDPAAIIVNAAAILSTWTTANLTTLATAFNAFMTSGNLKWGNYATFTAVKLAAVDTSGHYTTDPLIYEVPSGTLGGSSADVPPQLSVVMSLRTASTFGTANYGRMYLPYTRLPLVAGDPIASPADCLATATNFVTLIHAINTVAATHGAGDVVSNMSQKGTGTTKAVTRVACGSVVDTQRRRRDQLDETYAFAAV